jgi:hypothetical protein
MNRSADPELLSAPKDRRIVFETKAMLRPRSPGEIDSDDAHPNARDFEKRFEHLRRLSVESAKNETRTSTNPIERRIDNRLERRTTMQLRRETNFQSAYAFAPRVLAYLAGDAPYRRRILNERQDEIEFGERRIEPHPSLEPEILGNFATSPPRELVERVRAERPVEVPMEIREHAGALSGTTDRAKKPVALSIQVGTDHSAPNPSAARHQVRSGGRGRKQNRGNK